MLYFTRVNGQVIQSEESPEIFNGDSELSLPISQIVRAARSLYNSGKRVDAIVFVRAAFKLGLKEAKDFTEMIAAC